MLLISHRGHSSKSSLGKKTSRRIRNLRRHDKAQMQFAVPQRQSNPLFAGHMAEHRARLAWQFDAEPTDGFAKMLGSGINIDFIWGQEFASSSRQLETRFHWSRQHRVLHERSDEFPQPPRGREMKAIESRVNRACKMFKDLTSGPLPDCHMRSRENAIEVISNFGEHRETNGASNGLSSCCHGCHSCLREAG